MCRKARTCWPTPTSSRRSKNSRSTSRYRRKRALSVSVHVSRPLDGDERRTDRRVSGSRAAPQQASSCRTWRSASAPWAACWAGSTPHRPVPAAARCPNPSRAAPINGEHCFSPWLASRQSRAPALPPHGACRTYGQTCRHAFFCGIASGICGLRCRPPSAGLGARLHPGQWEQKRPHNNLLLAKRTNL